MQGGATYAAGAVNQAFGLDGVNDYVNVPDAATLEEVIARHRVTTLWLTAALFNAVLDERPGALRGLRLGAGKHRGGDGVAVMSQVLVR